MQYDAIASHLRQLRQQDRALAKPSHAEKYGNDLPDSDDLANDALIKASELEDAVAAANARIDLLGNGEYPVPVLGISDDYRLTVDGVPTGPSLRGEPGAPGTGGGATDPVLLRVIDEWDDHVQRNADDEVDLEQHKIDEEAARDLERLERQQADAQERADRVAGDNAVKSWASASFASIAIGTEVVGARGPYATLKARLDADKAAGVDAAQAARDYTDSEMSKERTARVGGDSNLQTSVAGLTSSVNTLTTNLSAETSARVAGDNNVSLWGRQYTDSKVATETSARVAGDNNVSQWGRDYTDQQIAIEKTARVGGDNNLSGRITTAQNSANSAQNTGNSASNAASSAQSTANTALSRSNTALDQLTDLRNRVRALELGAG